MSVATFVAAGRAPKDPQAKGSIVKIANTFSSGANPSLQCSSIDDNNAIILSGRRLFPLRCSREDQLDIWLKIAKPFHTIIRPDQRKCHRLAIQFGVFNTTARSAFAKPFEYFCERLDR